MAGDFSLCSYHITEKADVKQKIWIPKNFFGKAVDFLEKCGIMGV
jgi:hypothetical protein